MAVSKRLRYEILRRDNHACRYCGGVAPDVILTVDHIVAVALGGSDDPRNLVAACKDCNSGKSATPADAALVADVDADAVRWARAMARANELATISRDARIEVEKAVWEAFDDYQIVGYLPAGYFASIETFLKAGLTRGEILDAVYIALGARKIGASDMWRYACGICWKRINQRQEDALALIEAEDEAIADA